MPIPAAEKTCRTRAPTGVSLPVLPDPKHSIRKSRMGPRRAAVLITIHILIAVHILQWVIRGMTITPVEPSESMYTIDRGELNAGFIFFSLAILSTLILGRFFCGWGCHIVALQDLCSWLMRKAGVKPRPFRSRLLLWAPLVLAVYMFAWPTIRREVIKPVLGHDTWAAVAPYIGEAGVRPEIKAAFVTERFWETFPPWYVAIPFLAVCGFACVYFLGSKGFCTYGCPYGGIFGPAERVAVGRIRVTDACEHCGHCTAACTSNVRVHEEVRDYGMVVDPGCMKCMDCVSVCPNNALYFGFGKPALGARPRIAGAPAKFKTRVYDLSWTEEIAYGAVFGLLVIGFRGMLGMVPLLMAVAIAGIGTFLVWKLVSMARLPSVRIQSVQLKIKGSVRPAGLIVGCLAALGLAAGLWGAVVNASRWRGESLDARITTPLDEILTPGYAATESSRRLAARVEPHLRRAGPPSEGGFGWDRSIDRSLRLARLAAIRGDLARTEAELRHGLAHSARSANGPSSAIEDPLVRVLMLRSDSADTLAATFADLLRDYPKLATVQLSLARIHAARGASAEAVALITRSVATRPADIRNILFATAMLAQLGRVDQAIDAATACLKHEPKSAPMREQLGLLLNAAGRPEEGLKELEAAADLDPTNPGTPRHLAALLRELGRAEEATKWEARANRVSGQTPSPRN